MSQEPTKAQKEIMDQVAKEWIDFSLNGDTSLDETRAKKGIDWIYSQTNLPPPVMFITDSPQQSVTMAKSMGAKDIRNTNYMGLGYWAGWCAWLDCYQRLKVKGVKDMESLLKWQDIMRAGVWDALLFEHGAFVCRRPALVKKDENGLLHNEAGPAIRFNDDFSIHAWRGVAVPKDWIENKDKVDPHLIFTHPNLEERRALSEILGWERILADEKLADQLKLKTIDEDKNQEIGTLIEVTLPQLGRSKFLRVQCATGRMFTLSVPLEMKTAREANAWGYGLDEKQFNPEFRT